jgi:hypothetical protein
MRQKAEMTRLHGQHVVGMNVVGFRRGTGGKDLRILAL